MTLELRGVTKRFGRLVANDSIDLVVEPGEIHCLVGENGAGKSTLMNVLCGLYRADEGEILIDGVPQQFEGPGDAIRAGIGMVHQHFMLVPVFSVAENVVLGHEQVGRFDRLDIQQARATVQEISERFGFDINPDALVENLPVGAQQRVEIIKAIAHNARVLIFDEPTAVLTPQETDELMSIMGQLRDAGAAIIFITHKLREVREIADRITVVRHGKVVGETDPSTSNTELAALMVGRAVELTVSKHAAQTTTEGLRIRGLEVLAADGQVVVGGVDLDVRGGEIVCVAGVQGNGQTELANALLGLEADVHGSARIGHDELVGATPRRALDAGVGFVPEDRQRDGLVPRFSVAENLMLDRSEALPFARRGRLLLDVRDAFAQRKRVEFDIRAPSIDSAVGELSGGNQQKVVLARELSRELRLLVAAQPTRGLDVGSIEFVHAQIVAARDAGIPVLVVSTELDEVYALADQIAVMYRGRIVGVVAPDTPRDALGLMMAGAQIEGGEE